ncbi:hypothetical protein EDD15DRAFT_2383824 [Pisolithus albus]|nr:hypothetical protein EDD15DRAFT_2383824 [Pisolithus albus]
MTSNFSALTFASEATVVPEHGPDAYERVSYYNGITGDSDHPELVYRSDHLTTPFPKPAGRFAPSPQEEKGSLGPVVLWIGVQSGSTSSDTAHDVSQEILALLRKNEVEDVVASGPPFMPHADSTDATHYTRRFLTTLIAVPLTTEDMEDHDSQGTLTLWFHENKDDGGNPSNKAYGVSNCHVLRRNTTINYVHKGAAAKHRVFMCGMRRFQRGLDDITKTIADDVYMAGLYARQIAKLQAGEDQSLQRAKKMKRSQNQLDRLRDEVAKYWSNINLQRNIGYVEYAPAVKVDEGRTNYTTDCHWGVFLAAEAKVKHAFEGNVVDLGCALSSSGRTTFKYPKDSKLRIFGCATREDLAASAEFDNEGQRCFMVGKNGSTTDLTVGRFSGPESFTRNAVGVESRELAIYNSGNKIEVFSAKGDSGSLVWHMKDDMARIVGQLHSGGNKGGSAHNHMKRKFRDADFYRTT